MKWLLSLVLVLLAVGTSAGVEAQLTWDMTPPAPAKKEPETKESSVDPTLPRNVDRKVRNARIGFGVSGLATLAGVITLGVGAANSNAFMFGAERNESADSAITAGITLVAAGGLSMIATGALLAVRKRKPKEPKQALSRRSGAIRWDTRRSQLVF